MDYGAKGSLKTFDVKDVLDQYLLFSSAFRNLKIKEIFSVDSTTPRNNGATFTVNTGTDVITSVAHGLNNGEVVNFTSDTALPGGLSAYLEEVDTFIFEPNGALYYVINATTDTFQVSTTLGGSAVDITSVGSGTHDWWTDYNKIVIDHNLGYLSPWIFCYNGTSSSGGTSYFMSDDYGKMNIRIYPDSTEIHIPVGFGSLGASEPVYFTCYQFVDTFDNYTADVIGTSGLSGNTAEDFGMKISEDGFDVKDCDDVNLVMSTSFVSNIIHMKGNNSGTFVTHNLGYIPSFLAYRKPFGKTFINLATDSIGVDSSVLEWSLYPDESSYYVIFKNDTV